MAKILDVITNPNPILRQVASEIDASSIQSDDFQSFLQDMLATMLKKDGVGLAAPQVGISKRVIVINHKGKMYAMINPQILKKSWAKKKAEEGCLSVPNVFGDVSRHKRVLVSYLDHNGKEQKFEASDMLARIIQHENDHLDGILFIDTAENIKKG